MIWFINLTLQRNGIVMEQEFATHYLQEICNSWKHSYLWN